MPALPLALLAVALELVRGHRCLNVGRRCSQEAVEKVADGSGHVGRIHPLEVGREQVLGCPRDQFRNRHAMQVFELFNGGHHVSKSA
uniref:Putative secreted protein n=1 Tax=Ixodes ricinus TaxID=34613 RepID=A0A6B0UA27_IXORI